MKYWSSLEAFIVDDLPKNRIIIPNVVYTMNEGHSDEETYVSDTLRYDFANGIIIDCWLYGRIINSSCRQNLWCEDPEKEYDLAEADTALYFGIDW